MPEFILDTSGVVEGSPHVKFPDGQAHLSVGWAALDSFTQGYIEALFFTETEGGDLGGWKRRAQETPGFSDLAPEALASILADCAAFQRDHSVDLSRATDYAEEKGLAYDEASTGRDFWFTRNHHGVGFWDRGLGQIGDCLARSANAFVEVGAYLGDDGKVYLG